MRLLRIAGGLLGALLLVALLAAWLAPRVLDVNRHRDAIASLATTRLGRPVRIAGPISLALLPQPVLVAAGVTVPDSGDGFGAEIGELRLQVGLGPLMAGRLEAQDLILRGVRLRLPWPPAPGTLQQRPPAWLTGRTQIEDGTVLVGGLMLSRIAATLSADPLTGTLAMDGQVAALGRAWRVTARLGRAGGDGSAPLEASLDGLDGALDTGGTFSGQVAEDGSVTGQVAGRGRDLSLLIAGPAAPWHAAGRFRGADGLALADELDVEIGGVPARGAVALRLLPAARLDAALAASRLDLAAWLPGLLQGGGATLPTSVDLSAEAATLAGGTLRRVRAAFDLAADGVSLREAEALLPGDATLTLAGRIADGRFVGTGRIDAPALRETLRWLQPLAPSLLAALPADVLQAATLTSRVGVAEGRLSLDGLAGTIDGTPATGSLAVLPGAHPAVSASVALAGPLLDPWLPAPPDDPPALAANLSAWPGRWGDMDLSLALSATKPRLKGETFDSFKLEALLRSGTLTVARLALAGAPLTITARGTLAPGGRLSDGALDWQSAHAAPLAGWLPGLPAALFHGGAALHATAAGEPAALVLDFGARIADLGLDAAGTADLASEGWHGTVALLHPGAPRLLEALGATGVASWLGDGSLSLTAMLDAAPTRAALRGFSLSAGLLRATGDLTLDRGAVPALTGQVDAETLPLPLPYARSPEPLVLGRLAGWRGAVDMTAAHVLFGLSPGLEQVAAKLALADGTLVLGGLTGQVAGGRLNGQITIASAMPPRVTLQGTLAGAVIAGPLLEGTIDLVSGRLDAAASLQASGSSPGTMLATLDGTIKASVSDGTLSGLDLAEVDAALGLADPAAIEPAVTRALQRGNTSFTNFEAELAFRHGAVAVEQGVLTAPEAGVVLTGTLDLPIDAADLRLALTPARSGAPAIGLRLIGPAAAPRRTPELAGLAGWIAQR